MVNEPLLGKVAFVTGAGSKRGIGHSVALRLARDGADIVAVSRSRFSRSLFMGDDDWKGLDSLVEEIQSLGRSALAIEASVENYDQVNAAVSKAAALFGGIDILVHCAGVRGPISNPVVDFSEKDWDYVFKVNVLGSFNVSKAVAKVMLQRGKGGKIVHIVSLGGKVPTPGSAIYNSSKAAQLMLARILALELAPHIDVYAVNPGAIITNLRDEFFEELSKQRGVSIERIREEDYQKAAVHIPKGRLGKPEEVAELIAFLVSGKAEYMTGSVIDIAGGVVA